MSELIEQLRIYRTAREAEDQIYELVNSFLADDLYGLGNDLRRSSAAVSHHIMEVHRLYSYRLKLDALACARREAEVAQKHLQAAELENTAQLVTAYENIIKQSWGLTKWLKANLDEKMFANTVPAE